MNGWIVCYMTEKKFATKETEYTDHYDVFIDDDAEQTSLNLFNKLSSTLGVYSVNRCTIVNSTEATYLNIPR